MNSKPIGTWINQNLHLLCENTASLSSLLNLLRSYELITETDSEDIQNQATTYKSNTKLYDLMQKKVDFDKNLYNLFCCALYKSGNKHILGLLTQFASHQDATSHISAVSGLELVNKTVTQDAHRIDYRRSYCDELNSLAPPLPLSASSPELCKLTNTRSKKTSISGCGCFGDAIDQHKLNLKRAQINSLTLNPIEGPPNQKKPLFSKPEIDDLTDFNSEFVNHVKPQSTSTTLTLPNKEVNVAATECLEMNLEDKVATAIAVPSKLKPAQIIGLIPKGQAETDTRLIFNKGNLKPISSKVKTRQVALLSIAGPFREGKSLLLSFMISYLRHLSQGKRSSDWMGESEREASLQEGFLWQNGVERETTGVNMCPEPFTLTSNDGSKFDVLLMDTPGVYDYYTEEKDLATIVGLSLLTSSALIFNISKQLKEDSLKSLKGFMDFGRMAMDSNKNGEKPFQSLTFLIWDWNNPSQFNHGALGGAEFLKYFLNQRYTTGGIEMRDQIQNSFKQVNCFLMPDPGKAVKENSYDGSVAGMAPKFATNIKDFIEFLLNPNTFPVKTISGNPVTGLDLLIYFEKCVEIFNSDKIPSSIDMKRVMTSICNHTVVNKSVATYKATFHTLKSQVQRSFLLEKELQEFHATARNKAIETFDNARKMGTDLEINESKIELTDNKLQCTFTNMCDAFKSNADSLIAESATHDNKARQLNYKILFEEILKSSVDAYHTKLREISKLSKTTAEFNEKALVAITAIFTDFEVELKLNTQDCFLLKIEFEKKREQELENLLIRFQKEEAEHRNVVGKNLKNSVEAYETKLKEISKSSITEAEYNQKSLGTIQDILNEHEAQSVLSMPECAELKMELEKKHKQMQENVHNRLQKEKAELKNRVDKIFRNSAEALYTKLKEIAKKSKPEAEFNNDLMAAIKEILEGLTVESELRT